MPETTDSRKHISRRKWLTIFSLFLWAQLVFSSGLTLWRYHLIYTQDWPVYPSNNSPQLEQFTLFIKSTCNNDEAIGYISNEYNSFARLNYELYPQPIYNLSHLPESSAHAIMAEKGIKCFVYDYASDTTTFNGTSYLYSNEQFILRIETAE